MDREKFIRCYKCDALHRVTPFDNAPIYVFRGNELEEQTADDWRLFMEQHAGHRLEPLSGTGEKWYPSGPRSDPMSVAYIGVTNGEEQFVVRGERKSIQEPLRYELLRGRLAHVGAKVEAQGDEIKKEMKNHFAWAPATRPDDDKIDLFVSLVKEVIQTLDIPSVATSEHSYADDRVSYGLFDTAAITTLMQRCAAYFCPVQLDALRRFVDMHRSGSDVMTIVVRRELNIERSA